MKMLKMKMKNNLTYTEYIEQFETGLFTELNELEPFEWGELYSPEELDILFLFKHGEKKVSKQLMGLDISTVAKMVFTAYNNNWKKKYKSFSVNFELGENYRISKTDLKNGTEKFTTTSETITKEGAYNSEELVVDGSTENSQTNENVVDENRAIEEVKTDFQTLQKQMRMLENSDFVDTVLNDVKHLLLLKIY